MLQAILDHVDANAEAILSGDFAILNAAPFAGFSTHQSPDGSTVVSVELPAATSAALPASHRRVDLFLLDAHRRLGRHYHRRANAHIHIIRGCAIVEVDGAETSVSPGDKTLFPAHSVHDVRAGDAAVLFASFQDHPILQSDGSVDYFAAPD
jgi:quercetin dioxygenase-like cupin family protein